MCTSACYSASSLALRLVSGFGWACLDPAGTAVVAALGLWPRAPAAALARCRLLPMHGGLVPCLYLHGPGGSTCAGPGYCWPAGFPPPGSCEVTALVRVTARRPGRPGRGTQVTLYVFVAPPATQGLGCRTGGEVRGPVARAARPGAARASPSEGVEVVTPAAPSALQLESDCYPRRKQPVHPNKYLK